MWPNVTQWGCHDTFWTNKLSLNIHYTSKYWNRFNPPNILISPSLMILIGVNIFQRYHQKQLGFLRRNLAFAPRQTKDVAYKTLVRPQLEYASPIWHPHVKTQIQQVEKVQRTAARWTCRRWRNRSSVGDMLSKLEWPSLEASREHSSLTFCYKIHSDVVSINKDRYLTPVTATTQTRASKINNTQYRRYLSPIVMPWRILSSLELFLSGIVFPLLRWMPSPQRSSKPL